MNAAQPRDAIPTISSGCISLDVRATTIAEGAVRLLAFYTTSIVLNTTICSVGNLCVMQCCLLLDLLFDQCKGVHLFYS